MFEDADNFADLLRGGLPFYLFLTLPILIIISSNPVLASHEFSVQRMSQFDVHGVSYGCRASSLNLEAKSIHTWQTSRHCIITRFQDMTIDQFRNIRAKAGGLIIMLPQSFSQLTDEEKLHIYMLEQAILAQEISIPVYFSKYNYELNTIIEDITIKSLHNLDGSVSNHNRESAISEMVNSVSANGYQIIVSGTNHLPNKQSKIPIIQGELVPVRNVKTQDGNANIDISSASKLPLIILVAHLDTFGIMNTHLSNVDVAILLTLIDAFSKIHNTPNMSPKYRLMFLISESGNLLNFQGAKKWLDTNFDENVQLQNAELVICLDSISQHSLSNTLYMHVSKPPKEGTNMNNFYKQLKTIAHKYENISVEGVHKKINLADVHLAWEHERFSMKRLPGFTLSTLKSHKDPFRTTIFENSKLSSIDVAQKSAKIIAETLASYIYDTNSEGEIFAGVNNISKESIQPWLQIKSTLINNDLKNSFEKYLKNVKITYDKPDLREPDFMLYDGQEGNLHVYSVKPAVFDLFLTFVIIAYLATVYFAIIIFPDFYSIICKFSNNYNSNNINNFNNINNINNKIKGN